MTEWCIMSLESLAGIMVKNVDFILVIMESCWSVLNRRVINSDLCIIKTSLWLLCWRLGEGWQECNKGNWLAAVAIVHSRDSLKLWAVGLAGDVVRNKCSEYILEVKLIWLLVDLGWEKRQYRGWILDFLLEQLSGWWYYLLKYLRNGEKMLGSVNQCYS